jgi:hypothetical protein
MCLTLAARLELNTMRASPSKTNHTGRGAGRFVGVTVVSQATGSANLLSSRSSG